MTACTNVFYLGEEKKNKRNSIPNENVNNVAQFLPDNQVKFLVHLNVMNKCVKMGQLIGMIICAYKPVANRTQI